MFNTINIVYFNIYKNICVNQFLAYNVHEKTCCSPTEILVYVLSYSSPKPQSIVLITDNILMVHNFLQRF